MAAFLDNCRFNPTLGGTTDWTYSSAVAGYQSPAAAGAVNGRLYKYFAIDGSNNWELGEGAYNTTGPVLARTTVTANSLGTTAKINFAAAPQVAIVAIKADLLSVEEANSFTSTQKDRASTNLGTVRAVRIQKFTASGTYTPDANLIYALIECQAPGGGGGGTVSAGAGSTNGAGGGSSGGRSFKLASAATIGASQTVTIGAPGTGATAGNNTGGAGGDTSVGTICIAKGGLGGGGAATGASSGTGAAATVAGTGDVTDPGNPGLTGLRGGTTGYVYSIVNGGNSARGQGGLQNIGSGGGSGTGYGAGGGGGSDFNGSGNQPGGPGAPAIVIITEYCSQ